jgi:hypothetical protein
MARAPETHPPLERLVAAPVHPTRQGIDAAAEIWGAGWDGEAGTLELPLMAGMFHGHLSGTITLEEISAGETRLHLETRERIYRLRVNVAVVLLMSLLGAVLALVWPFVPALLPLAPIGVILALSGWFLVLSRLVTNSPEDFLDLAAQLAIRPDEEVARE